jgi:HK97 family phage major capsid protein
MEEREKLAGLMKEKLMEDLGPQLDDIKAKAEKTAEDTAKLFEDNKAIKEEFDKWQGKQVTLNTNSAGPQIYTFKGYDLSHPSRNFKMDCPKEIGDEVAKNIYKALTSSNTGAYTIPTEYSNAFLGLAELSSYALSRARVIRYPGDVMKMPSKGTRATVDAQAFGTANAAAATTLGQLTWTIDKRVGGYESIYNDVLRQSNFDVVGEWVEPVLAEAVGQSFDGEMFTKTEFTTDIAAGGTSGATFSGAIADSQITYSKLLDVEFTVEQERGVNPEWVFPRGVLKYIRKLADTNGLPLFERAMEGPAVRPTGGNLLGYPVHIVGTSALSATPANGAICGAFGDPKFYVIGINQEMMFEVNPYVQMKEGITQFIMHATADGNIVAATAWAYIKRNDA